MDVILAELLEQIVMILAGLALTAVGSIGSFYITKLVSHLKEEELLAKVSTYVRWVEQAPAFQEFAGEERFEIVFSKIAQWCEANGIPVVEDELAILIEDAVKQMKDAAQPIYTGE